MLAYVKYLITFNNLEGKKVTLLPGSEIYVDAEEGIAYAQGCHFDIDPFEYIVFSTN